MILYTQLYCIIFKIKSLFSKYSIAVHTRFVEFTIDSSARAYACTVARRAARAERAAIDRKPHQYSVHSYKCFENNDFILKIIQYNWVYNITGNLF